MAGRRKNITVTIAPPKSRHRLLPSSRRTQDQLSPEHYEAARAIAEAQAKVARDAQFASKIRGEHLQPPKVNARSTWWRNRRLLAPHLVAWSVFGVAASVRGLVTITGDEWLSTSWFLGSLLSVGALGILIVSLVSAGAALRWKTRLFMAIAAGVAWLGWAASTGLSWITTAVLMGAYYLLAAAWWQGIRHGDPDGPPEPAAATPPPGPRQPDRDDVVGNWEWSVGCKDGPLTGTWLRSPEFSEHCESYTIQTVPGKHSLPKILAKLDLIASGLRRPAEEIIIERHPSKDSSLFKLSIVTASPVKKTVVFDGPRFTWDGPNLWLELGTYADGMGRVRIQILAKNSARHLVLFGGQGSGKTGLMNLLALTLRATGCFNVIYLDGQDGASSPQLLEHADWPLTGAAGGKTLRTALQRIFKARQKVLRANRWAGWQTSPEYPALAVIIDECQLILDKRDQKAMEEWENLASIARKLGVSFIFATQHPGLSSLGNSDRLRSLLQQYTMIVLRTVSKVANNILRVPIDPSELPEMPGFGFVVAGNAEDIRTAPWRADFLDDEGGVADAWFEEFPAVPWHKATATAAGEPFLKRQELAEAEQRRIEAELARLEAGEFIDLDDAEESNTADGAAGGGDNAQADGLIQPAPRWPGIIPAPRRPSPIPADLSPSQAAVFTALLTGADRVSDIAAAAELSQSQAYKLLGELIDAGYVEKVAHGQYQAAESDRQLEETP